MKINFQFLVKVRELFEKLYEYRKKSLEERVCQGILGIKIYIEKSLPK